MLSSQTASISAIRSVVPGLLPEPIMCRIGGSGTAQSRTMARFSGGFASFKDGQCAPATLPQYALCYNGGDCSWTGLSAVVHGGVSHDGGGRS